MFPFFCIWICGTAVVLIVLRSERADQFLLQKFPEIHIVVDALPNALGSPFGLFLVGTYALAWPLWLPVAVCALAYSAIRDRCDTSQRR